MVILCEDKPAFLDAVSAPCRPWCGLPGSPSSGHASALVPGLPRLGIVSKKVFFSFSEENEFARPTKFVDFAAQRFARGLKGKEVGSKQRKLTTKEREGKTGREGPGSVRDTPVRARRDAGYGGPLLARARMRCRIRASYAGRAGANARRDRPVPRAPARAGTVDSQQGEPLWPEDAHNPLCGQLPRPVPAAPLAREPCAPCGAALWGAHGS